MVNSPVAYNIAHLRQLARRRLPKGLFEFVDRGVEDEVALRNNRAAFERIKLVSRTGVDVSKRTITTSIFGSELSMPLAISPTGIAGLLWYEGELALAKAAATAKVPFTIATVSLTSMERIVQEAGGDLWFQLYMWADQSLSHRLIDRVNAVGFETLIVTVDGPVGGNREYNKVNGFSMPFKSNRRAIVDMMLHPRWLRGVLLKYALSGGMPRFVNFPDGFQDKITSAKPSGRSQCDALSWENLGKIRDKWPRKLVIKGIMHPDDAVRAVQIGADGIIVSNHGGRHLDSVPASIDVIAPISKAVRKRAKVILDSGIRRGSDVVKALALGADSVMVGRATLYGVAAGGEIGAGLTLELLRKEIGSTMAMLGVNAISEIGPHVLAFPGLLPMERPG